MARTRGAREYPEQARLGPNEGFGSHEPELTGKRIDSEARRRFEGKRPRKTGCSEANGSLVQFAATGTLTVLKSPLTSNGDERFQRFETVDDEGGGFAVRVEDSRQRCEQRTTAQFSCTLPCQRRQDRVLSQWVRTGMSVTMGAHWDECHNGCALG